MDSKKLLLLAAAGIGAYMLVDYMARRNTSRLGGASPYSASPMAADYGGFMNTLSGDINADTVMNWPSDQNEMQFTLLGGMTKTPVLYGGKTV